MVVAAPPVIGVLALQGDVQEHLVSLAKCDVTARPIRRAEELDELDGIVIPGGESTTISKLLDNFELLEPLKAKIKDGFPAYGSCAGMILLANNVLDGREDQHQLGGLDVTVRRNAFGRQIDSFETDRSPTGAMLTWLEEDVMATNREWVIAFWHHPPYTKGSHDSDNETELEEMRANALPILEAAGVDLVMTGHSHSYERSFLLNGHYGVSGTLTPEMTVDPLDGREGGDGPYRKPTPTHGAFEGAVYVVAGSSGQVSGGTLDHPVMVSSLNLLGSLVLDISALEIGDHLRVSDLSLPAGVVTEVNPEALVVTVAAPRVAVEEEAEG